eukprot:7378614-Prymnesium_polylepis.2
MVGGEAQVPRPSHLLCSMFMCWAHAAAGMREVTQRGRCPQDVFGAHSSHHRPLTDTRCHCIHQAPLFLLLVVEDSGVLRAGKMNCLKHLAPLTQMTALIVRDGSTRDRFNAPARPCDSVRICHDQVLLGSRQAPDEGEPREEALVDSLQLVARTAK